MLLEGSGGWREAQLGPRAGVGRDWGGALSLVKAREEPGLSTVRKGGSGGRSVLGPRP